MWRLLMMFFMLKKLKLFEGNGRHMHEISVEEACAIWGDGHTQEISLYPSSLILLLICQ
jgi:hypothetical protein